MSDTKIIDGIPGTVVSEAECEAADYVVCGPTSHFADDVHTTCSSCDAAIVHRPYAPLRPPKICVECFIAIVGPKH